MSTALSESLPFIEFRHNLKFDFKGVAPIGDVAASLLALERLLLRSGPFLKTVSGVMPAKVEVRLEGLSSGSLFEEISVRYLFKTKKQMNKCIDNLAEKTGSRQLMASKWFVPVFVGAVLIGGGAIAYKWATGSEPVNTVVNVHDNTVVVIGAEQLKMTPEETIRLVMNTVNKTRTAQDAVQFMRPARTGKGGDILFDGGTVGMIAKATVDATPKEAKPPVGEIVEEVDGVEIEIRALDLDNTAKWAAVVLSQGGARHPLAVSPGIDVAKLRNRQNIRGDILVHARTKQGKNGVVREIVRYELLSVAEEEDASE